MKIWSTMAACIVASVLILGAAGCASNSRGVESTGEVVSDSWITTKVKSDMAVEKDVSATHISVKTYEGVVTLSGTADSKEEADNAVTIARNIKGVKSVVNNIVVKS